jgi:3-oxoacyl-[acyl-carrier-protein] synthase III/acyl carrier protein
MPTLADLESRLLDRLREVQRTLGIEPPAADAGVRFADAVDSMGLVEFLALLAEDLGVSVEAIEQVAGRRFGTVAELAAALSAAGLAAAPSAGEQQRFLPSLLGREGQSVRGPALGPAWLAATAVRLPAARQPAAAIDALLGRPPGWLEAHAGIRSRHLWVEEDPLDVAARSAADCLEQGAFPLSAVSGLLVTSEAPPLPAGLAAALHHRLGLPPACAALEIGGACTGFLAALWIARRFLAPDAGVLVLAIEAPSRWLATKSGAAGEAAALFGDGAAGCLLTGRPAGPSPLGLLDVVLETDGGAGGLLGVAHSPERGFELVMDGPALAQRAVRAMARAVRQMAGRHGLEVADLDAVVMHGGNGRIPALLARCLGLPPERVRSATANAGNLGSASLPAAWAAGRPAGGSRPAVVWTAAGAGLQWGAALWSGQGTARGVA